MQPNGASRILLNFRFSAFQPGPSLRLQQTKFWLVRDKGKGAGATKPVRVLQTKQLAMKKRSEMFQAGNGW
jgi:hypothetical protein